MLLLFYRLSDIKNENITSIWQLNSVQHTRIFLEGPNTDLNINWTAYTAFWFVSSGESAEITAALSAKSAILFVFNSMNLLMLFSFCDSTLDGLKLQKCYKTAVLCVISWYTYICTFWYGALCIYSCDSIFACCIRKLRIKYWDIFLYLSRTATLFCISPVLFALVSAIYSYISKNK